MNTISSPLEIDDAQRFLSLTAFRIVHNDLLKRYRELENKSEITSEIESFLCKGQSTGGLLSNEDDRIAVQSLLDYWASILFRSGYGNIDPLLEEYDPNLVPELDNSLCPYLGLEAFNEQKKNLFFGRQRLVDALLDKLKTNSLLAVIGSSGTGKSSVVLAGLLPYLKTGALPESENWQYYDRILPGRNPLKSLAQIICPNDANPNDWIPEAVAQFLRDPSYLTQVIDNYRSIFPSVLVIDQFEEVFTLCQDKSARQAFIDNILGLVKSFGLDHKVILTMRADFESQVVTLGDDFQASYELAKVQVTYLGAGELREAIEKPAELVGLKFEKGLITALVNDVLGEPAALPLLQFTLLKLWDGRERNRITWDAYKHLSGGREVGGAREALQRIAEEFYNKLIPEERDAVKRILLRMVRPREGSDFTSNRVTVRSLYRSGEDDTLTERVLKKLIAAGLVRLTKGASTEADQVEVAHEALVRNWQRLGDWLEHDRKAIRERLHLTEAVEQWLAKNKEIDLLWRGNQLEEALKYDDLNIIETEFVSCSQKVERTEIARKQKQEEVRIRLDEKLKLNRKYLAGSVTASFIISCLTALSIYSAWEAKKAKEEAVNSSNSAQKSKFFNIISSSKIFGSTHNPLQALVEAIRAAKELKDLPPEVQKNQEIKKTAIVLLQEMVKKAYESGTYNLLEKHTYLVRSVSFSENFIVSGNFVNPSKPGNLVSQVIVWDKNGKPRDIWEFDVKKDNKCSIRSLSVSKDEKIIVIGCTDGSVHLWDGNQNHPPKKILTANEWELGQIRSVSFSPSGKYIAVSTGIATKTQLANVLIWDANGKMLNSIPTLNSPISSIAFSKDEQKLALGFEDKQVRLLIRQNSEDWQNTQLSNTLPDPHTNKVLSVSFSPDGRILASASDDGTVFLRDTNNNYATIKKLLGHGSGVRSVSFSPDGKLLASASDDGSIKLWMTDIRCVDPNTTTNKLDFTYIRDFQGYSGVVYSVSFSPDGKYIVSGHGDGNVRIWKTDIPGYFKTSSNPNDLNKLIKEGETGSCNSINQYLIDNPNAEEKLSSNPDELIKQGCDWVKDYLKTNPNVDEKDRQLCGE